MVFRFLAFRVTDLNSGQFFLCRSVWLAAEGQSEACHRNLAKRCKFAEQSRCMRKYDGRNLQNGKVWLAIAVE